MVFEANYVSALRTSESEKEVCLSLEQFIEIRFNKELEMIDEFKPAIQKTEGHLFFCQELEDKNLARRRFKKAIMNLLDFDDVESDIPGLKEDLEKVKKCLGGATIIEFNSVKQKIRLKIR